jgi:hypothetical protein
MLTQLVHCLFIDLRIFWVLLRVSLVVWNSHGLGCCVKRSCRDYIWPFAPRATRHASARQSAVPPGCGVQPRGCVAAVSTRVLLRYSVIRVVRWRLAVWGPRALTAASIDEERPSR